MFKSMVFVQCFDNILSFVHHQIVKPRQTTFYPSHSSSKSKHEKRAFFSYIFKINKDIVSKNENVTNLDCFLCTFLLVYLCYLVWI